MLQYHFQFRGKLGYMPPKGSRFADADSARLHAEYMASHLGDIDPTGSILVTDDAGAIVVRCPARRSLRAA